MAGSEVAATALFSLCNIASLALMIFAFDVSLHGLGVERLSSDSCRGFSLELGKILVTLSILLLSAHGLVVALHFLLHEIHLLKDRIVLNSLWTLSRSLTRSGCESKLLVQ